MMDHTCTHKSMIWDEDVVHMHQGIEVESIIRRNHRSHPEIIYGCRLDLRIAFYICRTPNLTCSSNRSEDSNECQDRTICCAPAREFAQQARPITDICNTRPHDHSIRATKVSPRYYVPANGSSWVLHVVNIRLGQPFRQTTHRSAVIGGHLGDCLPDCHQRGHPQ